MPTSLSAIPSVKRRQVAATLGLFAVLLVAVGVLAATGPGTAGLRAFSVIALVAAVVLALLGWGVLQSVRLDRVAQDEREVDALITDTVTRRYGSLCDCGHEHDPTELHVTDACAGGSPGGAGCKRDCDTCVLTSALRPSPTATRAERATRNGVAQPDVAASSRP